MTGAAVEPETSPFAAFAKVFAALAQFFGDPEVQRAGRKLMIDLELDDVTPSFSPTVDRAELGTGEPERIIE